MGERRGSVEKDVGLTKACQCLLAWVFPSTLNLWTYSFHKFRFQSPRDENAAVKHLNRYVWLDLIRGLSALAVCAGHLRAVMFVDYAKLQAPGPLEKIFYFMTGLGHEAVMVFFVLSGFFVGGSVLSRKDSFKFEDYLLARLSRLWVVLIPAMLFTVLIDQIIGGILPGLLAGEHHSILNSGPAPNGGYSASIGNFFANLLFLQTLYVPVFGTNGPLWSLTNEFWYYMLFPLLMVAVGVVKGLLWKRIVSLGLFFLIALAIAGSLLSGFAVWSLGVVVHVVYQRKKSSSSGWIVFLSGMLFCISLVDSKAGVIYPALQISGSLFVGICFSLFVISLKGKSVSGRWKERIAFIARWLSEISYTLYLFHFPVFVLLYAVSYSDGQLTLTLASASIYIAWFSAAVVAGVFAWWLFERNTPLVRKHMRKLLCFAWPSRTAC